MPVVSKHKAEDTGEIQVGPPLNGNTLPRTLEIFHKHHETCSKRRKNGVSYEIRVEAQRSEWLTRKYLDNLRQQQALQGPRSQLNSSSDCSEGGNMETVNNIKQSPGPQEKPAASQPDPHAQPEGTLSSNGVIGHQSGNSSGGALTENGHSHLLAANNGHSSLDSLTIKREPLSAENPPPCNKSQPATSGLPTNSTTPITATITTRKDASRRRSRTSPGPTSSSNSIGTSAADLGMSEPRTKKRRLSLKTGRPHSLKMRSFSSPDDSEDDLKLKAEDCFSGVISTPPIKPLEEEDAPITTPSPPTSASSLTSKTSSSSVAMPTVSAAASAGNNGARGTGSACVNQEVSTVNAGDSSLLRELDEFSKVVDRVSKEESMRERCVSLQTNLYGRCRSPEMAPQPPLPPHSHVISPPPYPTSAIQQAQQAALTVRTTAHYYTATQHTTTMQQRRQSIPEPPYLQSVPPQYAQPPGPAPLPRSHPQMHPQVEHSMFVQPSMMQQSRPSEHGIQRHPQLQHLSVVSSQAPPSQPSLMSPTICTPISTHGSPFSDPASSIAVPVHTPTHPHTPTTPMDYFTGFPPPPHAHSRVDDPRISPSHLPPRFQSTPGSLQPSVYPYGPNQSSVVVRSPTITAAGNNSWSNNPHMQQQGILREALLSKVHSHLDDMRRPTQEGSLGGYSLPSHAPPRMTQSTTVMHPATSSVRVAHMQQQQSQYPSQNYTGSNSSAMRTISYQGLPAAYPHQI